MHIILALILGCAEDPKPSTTECKTELDCVIPSSSVDCENCDSTCELDTTPVEHANHVEGEVSYEQMPPSGGDHNPCWAEWGVHTEAVDPENWVHNLEHGGVVFLYNCPEGCDAELELLTEQVTELDTMVLLTPFSDMDTRFAVIAWEHRLLMGCLDLDRISEFYTEHVDQAPESVASMPPSDCMD
jgi:hypothetical protein